MLQIAIEYLSPIMACAAGVFCFRFLDRGLSFLFYQVAVWVLVYPVLWMITNYQSAKGLALNNLLIINISIVIEFALLWLAIHFYFKKKEVTAGLITASILFIIIYLWHAATSGMTVFAKNAFIFGGFVSVLGFGYIIYNESFSAMAFSVKSSYFWACLGLVVFFGVNTPYLSIVNYLNNADVQLSARLFHMITDFLANVRYISLGTAFILARKFHTFIP